MIKKTGNLNKNKIISRRLFVLVAAKIGLLGIVTSRLYNLQISEKQKYEVLSDKNRIREWKTPPQRGIITDYFNNVLQIIKEFIKFIYLLKKFPILIIQFLNLKIL